MSKKMSDAIKIQVLDYIEHVQCGTKPIALMNLQSRYVDEAKNLINSIGLNLHVEDVKDYDEWKVIYIYKHSYLIDIIKNLPDSPQTPYEHWILGKACGYSDEAIGEFVEGRKAI
ncbi:hypothetical protein AN1V17_47090 [Vallitalea sediminicola]